MTLNHPVGGSSPPRLTSFIFSIKNATLCNMAHH
jgi:hypothetical protein